MTWSAAKIQAAQIIKTLRAQFQPEEIRLILRALTRQHQKEKDIQTPTIIIAEVGPDTFQIDVSGRFGGGFRGFHTDRAGVISRIGMLKSYDCGQEPAALVVPETLKAEFQKVFPKSF